MEYHLWIIVLLSPFLAAAQDTWCGKHYMQGSPVVLPGGQFQAPQESDLQLLNLQCWPGVKPYLAGETSASVLIDSTITSSELPGVVPFNNPLDATLRVSISIEGVSTPYQIVDLFTTGMEIPISLASLTPRKQPYIVTCTGTAVGSNGTQTFESYTQLHYLPPPSHGSVTKQDFRTGSLLVKSGTTWEPIFPIGFYTSFDGFLTNISNVDAIKARGLNLVHPVPTFDNMTAFVEALDRMEELGLWLMYDMRSTYQNLTSVTEQVNFIKGRKNLLLWYTGDEPDGTSDPLNATKVTYDHIYSLDGYHPVSLVLNCQDYFFSDYSLGADVLLQDTYPIDINATFSRVWNTSCTPDFGDCGCDNCVGSLDDISTRVDEFKQRLALLGRARSTAVWTVPQAFGNESYWPRYPSGKEWLVESILGINHGSLGLIKIVPWDDPTSPDIMVASSALAAAVPQIVPFLASPNATIFTAFQDAGVDGALWTPISGSPQTLLLLANTNPLNTLQFIGELAGNVTQVLDGGAKFTEQNGGILVTLEGTGTGAWIVDRSTFGN